MERHLTRRELLGSFLAFGALAAAARTNIKPLSVTAPMAAAKPLRIVHLSDLHWGYRGDWNRRLPETVARVFHQVAELTPAANLIVVTGDLIQAADGTVEREKRLAAVKERLEALRIPWLAIPGEHDAFGDQGALFRKLIGPLHFHRVFQGLHIFGLDNVSQGFFLGRTQVQWLAKEAQRLQPSDAVLVLSHAPLYDLFTPWNWYTFDGEAVFRQFHHLAHRQFLFGHIHQGLDHAHHGVMNHAGLPVSWPLPEPGPMERLAPWPQGASHPDMGLGFRLLDIANGRFQCQTLALEDADRKAVLR